MKSPRSLPSEGSWDGKSAVIVGGGPSLKVFDWSKLLGSPLRSIAINGAYQSLPNATIWFTEDARVVSRFGPLEDFQSFQGIKLLHLLDEGYLPEITPYLDQLTIIPKKQNAKFWSKRWEDGLSVSSNSGIGALNVADLLGASTIFLLGFDCRSDSSTVENFHSLYPKDWAVGAGVLADYASDFKHWAALHLRHRKVVNVVNPAYPSALDCWERISYEDFYNVVLHAELSRPV